MQESHSLPFHFSLRSTELPEGVWLDVASYTEKGKLANRAICPWQGVEQEISLLWDKDVTVVRIFFLDENQTSLRIHRELNT